MRNTKHPPKEALNKLELLSNSPLLSALNDEQLKNMSSHIVTTKLQEDEVLFNQGDEYHSFYLVVRGLVKLFRISASGQEKIIELEGAGETFAEALMFNEQPNYPVTAKAMQPSVLFKINAKYFRSFLLKSPQACMSVMADLSYRLHTLIKEIDNLSLLTGNNRLSMYLLDQALTKGKDFHLEIPKNVVASILSLKPETFSRLLKDLSTRKIIKVKGNLIQVLDLHQLRKSAGIIE
jgi:CRP-like cAMP-binding protein